MAGEISRFCFLTLVFGEQTAQACANAWFTTTETSVTLAVMKAGSEDFALSSHSAKVVGLLALVIPLSLFVALKWLHEPKFAFHQVSIVSNSPDEPAATLARVVRDDAALIRRAHTEIIALTLLALVLVSFLLVLRVPKWTKYVVIASALASIAACWLQW
jgi:hypothetical protein